MGYGWDFRGLVPYAPAFLRGVMTCLELALFSSLFGTLLGIPLAILTRSRHVGSLFSLFVDFVRAVPNLVLIFFFYYFPYDHFLGLNSISGFASALSALTMAQAAYSADLIRGALGQVPRTQVIGVQGIGFTRKDVVRDVIVPSVTKQVLAGHVALWIGNVKLSSLAAVIGVEEVVYVARVAMAQNFRALESWVVVAIIYAALVMPLAYVLRGLEQSDWIRRQ